MRVGICYDSEWSMNPSLLSRTKLQVDHNNGKIELIVFEPLSHLPYSPNLADSDLMFVNLISMSLE